MTTTEDKLAKVLAPFLGASDHPENRAKLKILLKNFLPALTEEDMDTAITGILSVPKGPNDSY